VNLQWFTSPEWANIVKALLHTLWQGAVMAVLLGLALRRLDNPVTRYRCSLAGLAGVLLAGLVTWAVLNRPVPAPVSQSTAPAASAVEPVVQTDASPLVVHFPTPAPKSTALGWTAWLALVWLAGATVMIGRAGFQVAGAERLRRASQPFQDARIAELLAEARKAVGLARRVRVAVTDKLTSPAVVGVLVPTLILPLSLTSTLSPEQIRFILLHELAHIRRGDYFANLFQLFAEALLFFNPAVWWMSRQMRIEREACCDALAIELSGAPADYARTLVHVAENVLSPASAAALAFGDKREPSSLADRVQRVLVPGYRPRLRLTWRAMLAALFVGGTLLTLSAIGTRVTVAAILSPEQRVERIEKKMTELGQKPVAVDFSGNGENAPKVEVSGVIRTKDGTPVPKWVYVNITSLIPRSSYGSSLVAKAGKFSGTIRAGTIYLGAEVTNFAPATLGPLAGLGTNRFENLDLVLERGFEVSLQLVDADSGQPVPAANVSTMFWMNNEGFQPHAWLAGADGTVTLTHCADFPVEVTVNAQGYAITKKRFDHLSAGEPLRLALRRGEPVSGTVLGKATGQPLAGAELHLLYQVGGESGANYGWDNPLGLLGATDANGNFSLNRLRRGEHYFIGVTAPGHESVMASKVVAGQGRLVVQLGPELIVHGHVTGHLEQLRQYGHERVLDRNWNEVYDNNSQGFSERVPVLLTNGAATFVFTNRTPGPVTLSGESYRETRAVTAPVDDWVVNLAAPETAEAVAAKVAPKREVIFRFKDRSGGVPRGTVQVEIPDSLDVNHLTAHYQELEITNGEARAQIAIGGRTAIEAKHMIGYWFNHWGVNGNLLSIAVTNGPGPMVIEIPLVPAGAIYAKARNVDGTPAGGLFFGVTELKRAPGRDDSGSLENGGDGFSGTGPRQWVSGPLPLGGRYQINAWRGNSFCLSEPVKLTEANPDAEVELQFAPGKKFVGQVLDAAGKPLNNAELKTSFTLAGNHGFGLSSLYSNERGWFELENANPELGEYFVEVNAPGTMAERVALDFGAQPQTIRLKRGHTLAGRVTETGTGYAIPDAEVRALDYDRNKLPMITTRTDADGRFEFNTLGEVNYTLFVEGGQIMSDKKFHADGNTNVSLAVKPYIGSQLKPKRPEGLSVKDAQRVLATFNQPTTLNEVTGIMTNQSMVRLLAEMELLKKAREPNEDRPGAIWDTPQENRNRGAVQPGLYFNPNRTENATHIVATAPPPAGTTTNTPQVWIVTRVYKSSAETAENTFADLKSAQAESAGDTWFTLTSNKLAQVVTGLHKPDFELFSAPQLVVGSGQEGQMRIGNETNNVFLDCTPLLGEGKVQLSFEGRTVSVVEMGSSAALATTNQFVGTNIWVQDHGGIVLRAQNAGGRTAGNWLIVVAPQIITDPVAWRLESKRKAEKFQKKLSQITTNPAEHFQQRLANISQRAPEDAASPSYTPGHQKMVARLGAIRLDRFGPFDGETLEQVMQRLSEAVSQQDTNQERIRFTVAGPDTNRLGLIDPATGRPVMPSDPAVDARATPIHLQTPLENVTVMDVLDKVVMTAGPAVKYSIQDDGVRFSLKNPGRSTSMGNPVGDQFGNDTARQKIIEKLDQIRLATVGPFDQTSLVEVVRQLNEAARKRDPERKGVNISIATNSFSARSIDLDSVRIKMSLVDVQLADVLDAVVLVADEPVKYSIVESGVVFSARDEKDVTFHARTFQEVNKQVHIKARFLEVPKGTLAGMKNITWSTNSMGAGLVGILSDANFRAALRALESGKGFKNLGEPEVTTMSGRQCQMRTTQVVSIITNFNFVEFTTNGSSAITPGVTQLETGPIFDVTPLVLSDGYTLRLPLAAFNLEFWGYATIPTNDIVPLTATNSAGEVYTLPRIWPAVELSSTSSTLDLLDNQTAVLSIGEGEQVRFAEPDQKREAIIAKHISDGQKKNGETEMLVFVTATIVDPAGNRAHTEEEVSHYQESAHFQIKAAPDYLNRQF